jgi:hypothetical protein
MHEDCNRSGESLRLLLSRDLEEQLERELGDARIVCRRSILWSGAGYLAKRSAERCARIAEVCVVEEIEVFGSELQRCAFGKGEVASDGHIHVGVTRPNEGAFGYAAVIWRWV